MPDFADLQTFGDFMNEYWWTPFVIYGVTNWMLPFVKPEQRDFVLPGVAFIVAFLSVYAPRILPETELDSLIRLSVIWLTVTGIVKGVRRPSL